MESLEGSVGRFMSSKPNNVGQPQYRMGDLWTEFQVKPEMLAGNYRHLVGFFRLPGNVFGREDNNKDNGCLHVD